MANAVHPIIFQEIDQELLARLDPEYVAFHNEHLRYLPTSESKPWDPVVRQKDKSSPFDQTSTKQVDVGSIRDILFQHTQLRVFTPSARRPQNGWPVFLWFHGGGWTLGDLDSDNGLCSILCKETNCVVVNVNYRHAPEDPYPAAIDDAMEALEWVAQAGPDNIGANLDQVMVGGTSAGGNLAAVLSLKAALVTPPIPIRFQVLIVPVIDNTATVASIWKSSQKAPWLTPSRMLWYRKMYLPGAEDQSNWDASPNLAHVSELAMAPKTWIAVSELDLLAPEALSFGKQLVEAGIKVDTKVYKGSTHSILALSGYVLFGYLAVLRYTNRILRVLSLGKQLVQDFISVVAREIEECSS